MRATLAERADAGPGDGSFEYSSAGSHLLSAILEEATGGEVLEFARSKFFDPLGIETDPAWTGTDRGTPEERAAIAEEYDAADFAWPTDPQGIHTGWAYMKLRPEDYMKLGQLYLDGGTWDGAGVVSSDWITEATATHTATSTTPNGYGYQWWTHTDDAVSMSLAVGYGGNLVVVVPDRDLVVVVASSFEASDPLAEAHKFDHNEAITLVKEVMLPALD